MKWGVKGRIEYSDNMYNLFSSHSSKVGKCRITVLTLQSKLQLESRALSIPHLSF